MHTKHLNISVIDAFLLHHIMWLYVLSHLKLLYLLFNFMNIFLIKLDE